MPDGVAERAGVCDPEGLVRRLHVGRCVHMAQHGRVLKDSACVAIADNAENIEHADGRRASPDIERGAARMRSSNRTVTQRACRATHLVGKWTVDQALAQAPLSKRGAGGMERRRQRRAELRCDERCCLQARRRALASAALCRW